MARTYSTMNPGQLFTTLPVSSSRYQLRQLAQTESRRRSCTRSLDALCTSGRTSSAAPDLRARAQGVDRVAHLGLDHHDDRPHAEVGVGPVEHEHVREPGHGDPEVRLALRATTPS